MDMNEQCYSLGGHLILFAWCTETAENLRRVVKQEGALTSPLPTVRQDNVTHYRLISKVPRDQI